MLVVTLDDDLAELVNQVLLDEQLVEVAFFRIYQQASYCLVQVVEHLFEVNTSSNAVEHLSVLILGLFGLLVFVSYHELLFGLNDLV